VSLLRDPNLAFALVAAGLLIGYIEFLRPGWILPGVCGATLVMLGIASLAQMPVNLAGLGLVALAALLLFVQAGVGRSAWFTALAVVSLIAGGRMLVNGNRIEWWVSAAIGLPLVLVTERLLWIASVARQRKLLP